MEDTIYPIGLFLLIAWGLGVFGYSAGSMIFVVLTIIVIAIILRIVSGHRY